MDNNVIVTLPGGASGAYVESVEFLQNHFTNRYELIITHKDGTVDILDLSELSVALQVVAGNIDLGSGNFHLTVHDPGTNLDHELIIPLGNYYVKHDVDVMLDGGIDSAAILHPGKVDKIPGMGLSTEDFTTLLMDKLTDFADNLVSSVDYTPATEMLSMTQTGTAGVVTTDIVSLVHKVDKVSHLPLPNAVNVSHELVLSQENFTTAYMSTLDFFDPAGLKSITLLGLDVMGQHYDTTLADTLQFTIPTAAQSDWAILDSLNPAFILNKDIVQDQINTINVSLGTNNIDILQNASDISDNEGDILANTVDISANGIAILGIGTDISDFHLELAVVHNDIATNVNSIANFNLEQGNQDNRLDLLENSETTNTSDIGTLKSCCTTQTGINTQYATDISSLQAIASTDSPLVGQHSIDINALQGTETSNLAALQAADATLTGAQVLQQGQIDDNKACCDAQQIQINDLTNATALTPNEMSALVDSAVNSNIITDTEQTKIDNLPANQSALNTTYEGGIAVALRDAWSPGPMYEMGDIVSRNGLIYIASAQNQAQDPLSSGSWGSPFQLAPQYRDFTAGPGQTTFTIPGRVFSSAYVYVNGVKIRDTQYTLFGGAVNTTLTLINPAVLNQWVSIEF